MRSQDRGLFFADDEGDDGALQVARKRLALFPVHWISLCVDVFHVRRSWRSALAAFFGVLGLYDLDWVVGFLHLDVALRAGNLLLGVVISVGRHFGCGRGNARGAIEAQRVGSNFRNACGSCSSVKFSSVAELRCRDGWRQQLCRVALEAHMEYELRAILCATWWCSKYRLLPGCVNICVCTVSTICLHSPFDACDINA